jgi:hypothetical protein
VTEKPKPDVRVGQVWQDNDPRENGRYLRIIDVDASRATVRRVAYNETDGIAADLPGVRATRIRLDRFRPTSAGYRLVQDAPEASR